MSGERRNIKTRLILVRNRDVSGAILVVVSILAVLSPRVSSQSPAASGPPIPPVSEEVDEWLKAAINDVAARKGSLDPCLVTAEATPKVIKVAKDGSGEFASIQKAIDTIPLNNVQRVIIHIAPGEYVEKVKVERTKNFVTFLGESNKELPVITWHDTAATHGTYDSATVIVEAEYFMAINILFKNTAPRPDPRLIMGGQAVALRISANKGAFYNCKFVGFQDTLCDDIGFHIYMDCHVEGTVDFVFGDGTSLFLRTTLFVIGDQGITVITAHGRNSTEAGSGYSFVHCKITGTGTGTFLGRAWKTASRVVYSYSDMGSVVTDEAWSNHDHPERDATVFYGEYKCFGPGADPSGRYPQTKALKDDEAKPFLTLDYIEGKTWLLPPPSLAALPAASKAGAPAASKAGAPAASKAGAPAASKAGAAATSPTASKPGAAAASPTASKPAAAASSLPVGPPAKPVPPA